MDHTFIKNEFVITKHDLIMNDEMLYVALIFLLNCFLYPEEKIPSYLYKVQSITVLDIILTIVRIMS